MAIEKAAFYTRQVKQHLSEGGCGGDVCSKCSGEGVVYYASGNRGGASLADDCYVCRGTGLGR